VDDWYQERSRAPFTRPSALSTADKELITATRQRLDAAPFAQIGVSAIKWELHKLGLPLWQAAATKRKTALLKQLAATDYPLALKLPTPDRYVTFYADKMCPGVAPVSELDDPATQLFEEVYQAIEADLAKIAEERNCPVTDVLTFVR
jgi:hypothetical protein